MKTNVYVEYCGKQVEEKELITAVKKVWTNSGRKVGDITALELYIKPEEASVYYVINNSETGQIEF